MGLIVCASGFSEFCCTLKMKQSEKSFSVKLKNSVACRSRHNIWKTQESLRRCEEVSRKMKGFNQDICSKTIGNHSAYCHTAS